MYHQLKIYRKFYNRIVDRQKNFEVRENDRDYQVGDQINFIINTDREGQQPELTTPVFIIEYIHTGLGMAASYVVLGLKLKENHVTN